MPHWRSVLLRAGPFGAFAAGLGRNSGEFPSIFGHAAPRHRVATILKPKDLETTMGTPDRDTFTREIEQELTLHLERASDLSERAKRANDAAQHEIDRALEIADELRGVSAKSESRAGNLRRSFGRR